MFSRLLFVAVVLFAFVRVPVKADTGPASDITQIRHLVERYVQAVDTVDLSVLAQVWSHSPSVSFIYPLGEEHGFEAIQKHVFQDAMGGMFSTRDLQTRSLTVHVNGDAAWSEFHWTFQAALRKDGSTVTTHGVETQIYSKEAGTWRLVHVHYSADPQSATSPQTP
jgi:ketosteroid isomerase-like protein